MKKSKNILDKANKSASNALTLIDTNKWINIALKAASSNSNVNQLEGFELDTLRNALLTDATHFSFTLNSGILKQGNSTSKILSNQPHAHIISGSDEPKLFERIWKGWNEAASKITQITVNRAGLERIVNQEFEMKSLEDVLYALKKGIVTEEWYYGKDSKPSNTSFLAARKIGIQRFIDFYLLSKKALFRYAFLAISILGFFHITSTSQDAGISGDEFIQHEYGKVIANYHLNKIGSGIDIDTNDLKGQKMNTIASKYDEMGADIATLEDPEKLMHLYGSSFDTFTSLLIHWLDVDDYMEFRHWWNSLFGWLIFLFGALLIRRLTGGSWLWASIGFLMLYFTPRIFGEGLNNPKDIPFALGYIMTLYYAIKLYHSYPHFRAWDLIGFIFGIELGISIRIGGLLFIGVAGVYMGLKYIQHIGWGSFRALKWKGFTKWISRFALASIIAYIAAIYWWPYGWSSPIENPMNALKSFTDFQVSLRQLFEGKLYDSDQLPPYYLSKYVFITLPIGVLVGIILYIIGTWIKRKDYNQEEFLILFAAVFPIAYIYIQGSSVYGGLRHILFTLPGFIIIGVMGYYKLSQWIKLKPTIAAAIAVVPTILPASFIIKNANLSYVYFNELIGGVSGAYGDYELDYYLASLKPCSDYLADEVLSKNTDSTIYINSYGMDQVKYYLRKYPNAKVGFTRFDDRSEKPWDYTIFYNAYMDQNRLKSGYYPPTGTVFAPTVDGKALGCVIKRPSNLDVEGISALRKENNPDKAIAKLKTYTEIDSISAEVWFYLGNAYAVKSMDDSARYYLNRALHIYPEFSQALFTKYQIELRNKKYDDAIAVMQTYANARPKDPDGYIMMGQAHLYAKNYDLARITVVKAISFNPFDARIYQIGAQCYQAQNNKSMFELWYKAALFRQSKTQQEQQERLSAIQQVYANETGEELDLSKYFR